MKQYIKYVALAAIALTACEPELDNSIEDTGFYTSGEADFSNFVAVGNSLTSGYADGALYLSGQQNSFPSIMAGQFELAGGGEFTQPLVADNLGGLKLGGQVITENRFVLRADGAGNLGPVRLEGDPATEVSNTLSGSFNNVGVPGAKSFHLLASGYGNVAGVESGAANPYFARFASAPDATVLGDAVGQNPTFFSLWIGNNDVLSFATSGGVGVDQTGNFDPSLYGSNDITDPTVFAGVYNQLIEGLTATSTGGVVFNIPDVTALPYFTTVPFAPLSPLDPTFGPQIPTLNQTFGQLNQAFMFLGVPERSIVFNAAAASAVVVKDESLVDLSAQLTQVLTLGGLDQATATVLGMQYGQARQATAEDLLVLPSSSVIGTLNNERLQQLVAFGVPAETAGQLSVNGVTFPLEDQFVLTPSEQNMIATAQASYNATIEALAQANGLAFVDVQSELSQLTSSGIAYDAGVITDTFASGGAFSLDGVHLTQRGYAHIANLAIEAINNTYESTVPGVNIGNYPTVQVSIGE